MKIKNLFFLFLTVILSFTNAFAENHIPQTEVINPPWFESDGRTLPITQTPTPTPTFIPTSTPTPTEMPVLPELSLRDMIIIDTKPNKITLYWVNQKFEYPVAEGQYRYSNNKNDLPNIPWVSEGVENGQYSGHIFGSSVTISNLEPAHLYYVEIRKVRNNGVGRSEIVEVETDPLPGATATPTAVNYTPPVVSTQVAEEPTPTRPALFGPTFPNGIYNFIEMYPYAPKNYWVQFPNESIANRIGRSIDKAYAYVKKGENYYEPYVVTLDKMNQKIILPEGDEYNSTIFLSMYNIYSYPIVYAALKPPCSFRYSIEYVMEHAIPASPYSSISMAISSDLLPKDSETELGIMINELNGWPFNIIVPANRYSYWNNGTVLSKNQLQTFQNPYDHIGEIFHVKASLVSKGPADEEWEQIYYVETYVDLDSTLGGEFLIAPMDVFVAYGSDASKNSSLNGIIFQEVYTEPDPLPAQ